jgi:hypothetical protein
MQPSTLPAELVVRSDNQKLRGRFQLVLLMHVALAVIFLAAAGVIGSMGTMGFFVWVWVILIAGQIFQIALQCYVWGGRLAINQPITMSAWGMELQTQQGTVKLPWATVSGVRVRSALGNRSIQVRVHPQAVPGQNGVDADPAYWPRLLKKGALIGEVGLAPGFETILPAIQAYGQGRVPIS